MTILPTLLKDLKEQLRYATDVYIVVALIKDNAFEEIQLAIPPAARQHFLVGIDLPTTPSVLKALQDKQSSTFHASIYKGTSTFHPKVYLIKTDKESIAFIGSSNLTLGGLSDNIEMNIVVSDSNTFNSLLSWFESLEETSYPLTAENIEAYEKYFMKISTQEEEIKTMRNKIRLKRSSISEDPLTAIDFSDRYFKKEHHLAFRSSLWEDDSQKANKERGRSRARFLELHKLIFPRFDDYGLTNLHPNITNHIVSMDYHFPGQSSQQLNAMWLSYGKSQKEIKLYHGLGLGMTKMPYSNRVEDDKQSFINHARLQIRIELKEIGIWILFGKNNGGSEYDRNFFKRQMQSKNYRDNFFRLIQRLPSSYWITIRDERKIHLSSFATAESLHDFCKRDDSKYYFIIGRDYKIADFEMSEKMLPITTLEEFQRLYPIYELMRDKTFA